ncbi:hypothetical protein Pan97_16790 [Bremerella volcania]|uniref:Uncharacterized protein n=1 Tax=Bremerella volcania TaxID=2527984 RepID=A0A518C627_9BACT|nr:hypothetical protein [Bremerella volcania]QDU74667.1 hypothetical protein Pan97_16790 [Bremerella volcania]
MEKPYRELARLVGRVLAKRWLNKNAKQGVRSDSQSKPPNADTRDEPHADSSEVGSNAPV